MKTCWRCGAPFIPASTGNCAICGYNPNPEYVKEVSRLKLLHELKENNLKSWGGNREYKIKKNWSMRDD